MLTALVGDVVQAEGAGQIHIQRHPAQHIRQRAVGRKRAIPVQLGKEAVQPPVALPRPQLQGGQIARVPHIAAKIGRGGENVDAVCPAGRALGPQGTLQRVQMLREAAHQRPHHTLHPPGLIAPGRLPQVTHLGRAHSKPIVALRPLGRGMVGPECLALGCHPRLLLKSAVPDFVGILHIDPLRRVQPIPHQPGKVADVLIGGLVGHCEPAIRAGGVEELHHHLHRYPTLRAIAQPVGLGTIRPGALAAVVGVHPIHKTEHPIGGNLRQKGGVEGLAGVAALHLNRHDADVAQIVAGAVGVGRCDLQENATAIPVAGNVDDVTARRGRGHVLLRGQSVANRPCTVVEDQIAAQGFGGTFPRLWPGGGGRVAEEDRRHRPVEGRVLGPGQGANPARRVHIQQMLLPRIPVGAAGTPLLANLALGQPAARGFEEISEDQFGAARFAQIRADG